MNNLFVGWFVAPSFFSFIFGIRERSVLNYGLFPQQYVKFGLYKVIELPLENSYRTPMIPFIRIKKVPKLS